MKKRYILGIFVLVAIIGGLKLVPHASAQKEELVDQTIVSDAPENTTPQTLPFSQNWTNAGLITANDDWAAVPGIEGNLGQDITAVTGTDPQTLLTTSTLPNDIDVIANQAAPDTNISGGVAEFDGIANPVIALQGSGTADAPYVIFNVNTTGFTNIIVAYNLRDIDGSADNSIQPVALQYRIGNAGNFTNVAGGFVADASSGPSLATLVTPVSASLGSDANNQALVQVRVMTTNAVGSDEWIGVDDVSVSGTGAGGGPTGARLFNARMNGANEVPANATTGSGYGRVVLNAAETQIKASFYWTGLTGNATAGHIHGPSAPTATGPVIFNLAPSATTSGSVVDFTTAVTPAQVADLKAGLWYFNIHTAANPGGEIRGTILKNTPRFDMDGDGDSDYGIVRPGTGGSGGVTTWYTSLNSGTSPNDPHTINQWGTNADVITPGDYDGDGRDDIAFWRSSGTPAFFILRSSNSTLQQITFGLNGDDPTIVGDYSGDGKDDPAIYRPGATASSQSFFWTFPSSGPLQNVQVVQAWGVGSDFAVPGDYDGDGRHDLVVARNIGGANTFIMFSSQSQVSYTTFGLGGGASPDRVVPGDYDGDGRTDFAITRNEGGVIAWWYRPSGGGVDTRVAWGTAGSDIEAQGDYDGNGTTDPAIWRPAGGSMFFALTGPTTVRFQRWGLPTDVPSIYDLHGE